MVKNSSFSGGTMKKIFFILTAVFGLSTSVFAGEKEDVMAVFDKYVQAANSYSTSLPSFYTSDAKIVRVVNKKQGGQKAVLIPFDRYLNELKSRAALARTVRYTNRYENRKVTKVGNDYKLSATRLPRSDKTGLPCYFVFTKQGDNWKIKEESLTTNVQTFLNAK